MAPEPVAFYYDPRCLDHDTGAGHPERPDRVRALRGHLERAGVLDGVVAREIAPDPAPIEDLARVHPERYIESIRAACARGPQRLDPDTPVSPGSWDAALLSAGAALDAAALVAAGRAPAAFVCTRPPGHHAERERAMGFCLFNNVAVAARALQEIHGIERVFIVDWDVHHGNGTQHLFEDDDTVFYFSTHQYPFYPGTGGAAERGRGPGIGFTLNVPLPPGTGDDRYLSVFREMLRPAMDRFRPGFILVSCGFDAHRDDPLAGMALTERGYGEMTRVVREAAEAHCGGRIVSVLEGGYDLTALGAAAEAHVRALARS